MKIHGALKQGFKNLYGYTSDQEGICHPLLDHPGNAADEGDRDNLWNTLDDPAGADDAGCSVLDFRASESVQDVAFNVDRRDAEVPALQ